MSTSSGEPFVVRYHPYFVKQTEGWKAAAETKPGSALATSYRVIERLVKDVLAYHPHDSRWVLSDLPVRRVKSGRMRVFFAFSPAKRTVVLLLIGQRKEGDKNDAYAVIERELGRGTFDDVLAELGLER